jgi:hypothetical protein
MNDYQRQEAIDLLCNITEGIDPGEIESYDDFGLEAWLGELGFEWDEDASMFGAWKPIKEPPPAFAPVAVPVTLDDFGPLFAQP